MLVEDKNIQINIVMNKIFSCINSNLNLKKDLEDYYRTIGLNQENKALLNAYTLNYIFERRLGEDKKTIFDYALNELTDINEEEKNIILAFKNSIDGVFEVRKIKKDVFELFNLTNEKTYLVKPTAKMNKFRNLSVGHFLLARILHFNNEYLLYHIVDHVTYSNRLTAFQIAVSRLAQNPALFCFDNPEKLEEIKEQAEKLNNKFLTMFKSNIVTTSNKSADNLIELLNEFIDSNKKPTQKNIDKYITPIDDNSFFDISQIKSNENLFVAAKKGFSAQTQEYNVSLLSDDKLGLIVIPYMDTFLKIFEIEDYTTIKNYKECIKKFIEDSQIAPLALQIANNQYPDIFIKRVNEILEKNYENLDEILHKNKTFYMKNPYTSSTTTLYSSYAFKKLLAAIDETETQQTNKTIKVGRNEPCPCGSGLKYKKCCGAANQI